MTLLTVSDAEWQEAEQFFHDEPQSIKLKRKKTQAGQAGSQQGGHAFIKLNGDIWALNNVHANELNAGEGGLGVAKIAQNKQQKIIIVKQQAEEDLKPDIDLESEKVLREIGYFLDRKAIKVNLGEKGEIKSLHPIQTNTKVYTAYQYRGNRDLHTELQEWSQRATATPQAERWCMALKCMMSIQTLHNLKILHRDIKPENFVLSGERSSLTVLPVDFDVSKKLAASQLHLIEVEKNGEPILLGTSGFLAEETKDQGKYSYATDTYAVGIVLKEIGIDPVFFLPMIEEEEKRITLPKAMQVLAEVMQKNHPQEEQVRAALAEYAALTSTLPVTNKCIKEPNQKGKEGLFFGFIRAVQNYFIWPTDKLNTPPLPVIVTEKAADFSAKLKS